MLKHLRPTAVAECTLVTDVIINDYNKGSNWLTEWS